MIDRIAGVIESQHSFLIVTHVNPDGDAVGSVAGLYNALLAMNKQGFMLFEKPLPSLYSWLPGCNAAILDPHLVPGSIKWIIALDCAEQSRIAADLGRFAGANIINIDHHPTNPLYGDLHYVDPKAMSTAELVYKILRKVGFELTKEVGMCLYAGLYTDTGGFRFAGVNSETLMMGAEMLAPGIDSYEITRPLYEEFPAYRLQLEAIMLHRIEKFLSDQVLISTLYEHDLNELGASMADTENFVNRLREIRGVRVGILITKMRETTRVSFRSKDVDVAKIAQELGGGGHKSAAGLKTELPIDELKSQIIELLAKAFRSN